MWIRGEACQRCMQEARQVVCAISAELSQWWRYGCLFWQPSSECLNSSKCILAARLACLLASYYRASASLVGCSSCCLLCNKPFPFCDQCTAQSPAGLSCLSQFAESSCSAPGMGADRVRPRTAAAQQRLATQQQPMKKRGAPARYTTNGVSYQERSYPVSQGPARTQKVSRACIFALSKCYSSIPSRIRDE